MARIRAYVFDKPTLWANELSLWLHPIVASHIAFMSIVVCHATQFSSAELMVSFSQACTISRYVAGCRH